MGIFSGIWSGIKWLGKLIFPFLAKATDFRKTGVIWLWLMHFAVVFGALVFLTYMNRVLDIGRMVRAPWPALRHYLLPIFFLLIYALCWLGWWLWQVIVAEDAASEFPDLDAAWNEALMELEAAGIPVREVPVFLLLGRSAASETALLDAAETRLLVNPAPKSADAPLHVYANRQAIYVTCRDVSLLARQAELWAESASNKEPAPRQPVTPRPGKPHGPFADLPAETAKSLVEAAPKSADADKPAAETLAVATNAPAGVKAPQLLKMTEEVERRTARLTHLCQLIARDRAPYCSLNGLLILLPYQSTNNDTAAREAAAVCRVELATVREATQVQCPWFVLLCDVEQAPGFGGLLQVLPPELLSRRLGQNVPLVPDLQPPAISEMIDESVRWTCNEMLSTAVYKLLEIESGGANLGQVLARNARLYHFLADMHRRATHLSTILTRAWSAASPGPALFGGCFLAGTGEDPTSQQAFVPEVFRLLIDNQNYVSWTKRTLAQDSDYKRLAAFGYTGLSLFVVSLLILWMFFWPRL